MNLKSNTSILLLSNAILAIALSTVLYFHWNSPRKIAYVHTNMLLNQYQGMIEAQKAYKIKAANWKANLDTLTTEWKQELKKFQEEESSMTKKERGLSQQLLQQKQKQLADYQNAIQQQAQQEDAEMTQKVIDEVNAFIAGYGQEKGYEVILAATDMGNIAYANEGIDITSEVLTGLNESYIP